MELEVPLQASRDDSVTHPITMETTSCSTGIHDLSHQPDPSTTPLVIAEDSSEAVARSHFNQWLKPVQHDRPSGSQSVPIMSSEALHEMSVAQVEEFSKIAQHLLTANLPNSDYEVILLCHKEDMEAQKEKIADETERDSNVDAWLNSMSDESIKDALKFFR